jgi:hypothetical protein
VTSSLAPRVRVPAAAGGAPTRHGLFGAANLVEGLDDHALHGVEYDALCGVPVDLWPMPCPGSAIPPAYQNVTKDPRRSLAGVYADPFAVYAAEDCSAVGRQLDEARTQLRTRLTLGEQATVERTVWTGEVGNTPALTVGATVLRGGDAVQLPDALGLLELWLATVTGATGTIHAPRWLAPRLAMDSWLNTSGARATTPLGTTWALGTGYPGTPPITDPVTVDDGALWLFATPPVTVRRSGIVEPADWQSGSFTTRTNGAYLLAERVYVVDWPCNSAAVKTTLTRADYVAPEPPEEPLP